MANINWRGNQGCDEDDPEGNGWNVEEWVDGSLCIATFCTLEAAEKFVAAGCPDFYED